ncbi:LuxR family transcriptional regulator [Pseudoxanthomonas sp. UTMC 1351]|uniref:LuxR family transcriptional regulator n=1 Tax=Pseudoxanthomonas sp. UTMC 1351 TaxID=2695853 RepID=UPI0034CE4231
MAVAALQVTPVVAGPPAISPLTGQWTLDVSTLPMPPEARPKSVDLDFRYAPDGKWITHTEIIDQNNSKMFTQSTLSLDGTPGRASGTYWADVVAAKMPAPNVLVMQIVYQGIPRSTRVFSVSADGKVLTETEAYFNEDGTPMMRTAFFSRVLKEP